MNEHTQSQTLLNCGSSGDKALVNSDWMLFCTLLKLPTQTLICDSYQPLQLGLGHNSVSFIYSQWNWVLWWYCDDVLKPIEVSSVMQNIMFNHRVWRNDTAQKTSERSIKSVELLGCWSGQQRGVLITFRCFGINEINKRWGECGAACNRIGNSNSDCH